MSTFKPLGVKNVKAKGLCCSFQVHLFLSDKRITDHKQQLPLHLGIASDTSIFTAVCPKQHSSFHHFSFALWACVEFKNKWARLAESGLQMSTSQINYVLSEKDTKFES